MAFEGGALPTLGITPSFVSQLATTAASSGVGQVWQGSGRSFFGSAAQSLTGSLAGSAVNIVMNKSLGTNVVGPQGLSLDSGANILASTITPYVTSSVAAGINQSIEQSLQKAGPFGPILSGIGTNLVNQAFNGLSNAITGVTDVGGTNYKMFPGGGGEPAADYGGSAYTLTDVTFSIQPANQGPQTFGDVSYSDWSPTETTLPWGTLNGDVFGVGSPYSVDALKQSVMKGDFQGDVTNLSSGIA
jgi:hypothetical protein